MQLVNLIAVIDLHVERANGRTNSLYESKCHTVIGRRRLGSRVRSSGRRAQVDSISSREAESVELIKRPRAYYPALSARSDTFCNEPDSILGGQLAICPGELYGNTVALSARKVHHLPFGHGGYCVVINSRVLLLSDQEIYIPALEPKVESAITRVPRYCTLYDRRRRCCRIDLNVVQCSIWGIQCTHIGNGRKAVLNQFARCQIEPCDCIIRSARRAYYISRAAACSGDGDGICGGIRSYRNTASRSQRKGIGSAIGHDIRLARNGHCREEILIAGIGARQVAG